jgi:hypothetical protein
MLEATLMEPIYRTRQFSLREANALVPLLKRTFTRARELREELGKLLARLRELGHPAEEDSIEVDESAPPAVKSLQARGQELVRNLLGELREVAQLGIEVKASDGLCDFRSRMGGRLVYLCWRFGEEQITHFHELHTGFAGRKPLPEGAEFIGELLH